MKNNRQTGVSDIRGKSHMGVVIGVGLSLALIISLAFIVSINSPKQTTMPGMVHGELINSPPPTNRVAMNIGPAAKEAPINPLPDSPVAAPKIVATETKGNYLQISFNQLADFPPMLIYQMMHQVGSPTSSKLNKQIPNYIRSLDNRSVALEGFMLPLKLENARVTEFLLMRSRAMCCFGKPLQINELAYVHMTGKGVKSLMDQPITVYGTFHVDIIRENGGLDGIYRLDGEKMEGPSN